MADALKVSDSRLKTIAEAFQTNEHDTARTALALGMEPKLCRRYLKLAAQRGLFIGDPAAWPGFRITKESVTVREDKDGNESSSRSITQSIAAEDDFELPPGHLMGRVTYQVANGKVERFWPRTSPDEQAREVAMREALAAFCEDVPRAEQVPSPCILSVTADDLCNQFTLTDYHFGMMAWGEETGGADWDLKIAEQLWCKAWSYAVARAPEAHTAILAQLGDLVHFDGLKPVTNAHGNVLDSDSRFAKIVRVVIRCMRFAVRELLKRHQRVHLIFSDANHDEAGEVWLREMFAAHFEDEPRVTVDRSPGTFNAFEWGLTSLFYHHGHKKRSGKAGSANAIDATWVARFRALFGRTKHSYGHTGHLHSDEMFQGATGIKVERHETLAAPSTYEASGGYTSGRSMKVITYSKQFGEHERIVITPEMVMEAA